MFLDEIVIYIYIVNSFFRYFSTLFCIESKMRGILCFIVVKDLLRITKLSAKGAFKSLKKNSPYFCVALNIDVFITKYFLNHIAYQKNRSEKEVIERLLIISFLEDILKNGELKNSREMYSGTFHQISLQKGADVFCAIISTTPQGRYILTSCFREYEKKRTLS